MSAVPALRTEREGRGTQFVLITGEIKSLGHPPMKYNPQLKVLLNAGYFDLATPFYQGVYEMQHLPMPLDLQKNIEYKFYESGHMVYAHEASLKAIHDNVAAFIRSTDNSKSK